MLTARTIGVAVLALLLGWPCPAAAQEGGEAEGDSADSNLARVQRDQSRIGLRVSTLRDKMERLAQRYEDEGRTRNATLLREALQQYDEKKLTDLSRELERNLEQGNLSTVEQQDLLARSLEDIYSVLRDRRDADELMRQADLARQGSSELSFLAQNERSLLSATRAATDRPGDLLEQALDLVARLGQALKTTEDATQAAQAADGALGDAALADTLARQQRALAADALPTAQTQALLQEALALLRERLDRPGERPDGAALGDELLAAAQAARAEAAASATRADAAMSTARERLERVDGTRPESEAPAGAGQRATQPPAGAKPDGARSGAAESDATPSDPTPSGETPTGSTPTGSKPSGAAPTGETSSGSKPAGDTSAPGQPGSDTPESAKPEGATPESAQPAGAKPEGGQPRPGDDAVPQSADELAEARAAMNDAARQLEATRDALDRSERSLAAAKNRAQALATATTQDAARDASGMEDIAQRLEAVQPQEGPELLDRTRQLIEDLSRLAQSVEQGDLAGAQGSQQTAQANLDELIQQLQARAARTPDEGPRAPDQGQLDALAQQQEELAARARELMKRLSELPDQKFTQPGDRAVEAMDGAEKALRAGDSNEAAVREEEAAEKLEEAAGQLSGERDRYEQLRQEEVLFRLGEDLKTLVEKQDALSLETKEIDDGRGDDERLGRSQSRAVGRLASQERDLSSQAERLRAALEKDGSVVFTFAMERTRDDLSNAADLLGREQTGFMVQAVQSDARRRLADLLDVLDKELQRRRDAQPEEPPPGMEGQQGPEPLVPTVAELLLVQRMEQAALARLENFQRLNPQLEEEAELSSVERSLIERWALEHVKVTEMFKSMIPQGESSAPGEGEGGPRPGEPPPQGETEGGGR